MAASTGIVGALVVMLSKQAVPIMLREKYRPELAAGTIAATGTLGILIPPSIMSVLVGDILQISVGELSLGVLVGATIFGMVFKGLKGDKMIENAILFFELGADGTLGILLLLIFVMGGFLEWVEISFIALPLFAPIVAGLDFGLEISREQQLLWFAMLVAVNLQTSFLTPPFGYFLFYIKGVAPPEISIRIIYCGIIPFVGLRLAGLSLLIIWPGLVLWVPDAVFGN